MTQTPDQTLLTAVFQEFIAADYPGMGPDDAFERFTITQLRKPGELSGPELEAGIVDGTNDGGIDGFFVFLNGVLLSSDDPYLDPSSGALKALARNPRLEILIVQAKNQNSWKEAAWEKLLSTLSNVLNLTKTDVDLEDLYNAKVVEATGVARAALRQLASKFPSVSVRAAYVTRATEAMLTTQVEEKRGQVENLLKASLPSGAEVVVENIGAEALYILAAQPIGAPATLTFRELVREASSYMGVVALEDYLAFVRDPATGSLREEMFDSNVRDFEGDNKVNASIGRTLSEGGGVEFWWLNNGVTVLGDEVSGQQKVLTIARPLIVNGLQTSHVLHRAEAEGTLDDSRRTNGVVVRVIESTDEEVRDRVIEGTNRQTPVPGAALMATDAEQIKLEHYLKIKGFYYERRKNRYKNLGQPASTRVSMSLLGQIMITVLRGEPDQARARPSSILTRKGGWETVFPEGMDFDAYVRALSVHRDVQAYLSDADAKRILDDPTNARFYVLAGYVLLRANAKQFASVNFAKAHPSFRGAAETADLVEALTVLARTAKRYQSRQPEMSRDAIFKSADFRVRYLAAIGRAVAVRSRAAVTKDAAADAGATTVEKATVKNGAGKKTAATKKS